MTASRALVAACIALILVGCDENPLTGPGDGTQDIIGRVISDESNVSVAAWQASLVKSTVADSAGFFALEDLPVGLYEVRFTTPSGRKLHLKRVVVDAERATTIGPVRISPFPWPIDQIYPNHGASRVPPLYARVQLLTTEELDLASLTASTSFQPPVEGAWFLSNTSSEYYGLTRYQYEFLVNGPFDLVTNYTCRIDSTLRLLGGQAWGDSLVTEFQTDSLKLATLGALPYYGSNLTLLEPRRDFQLISRFNTSVNADSLTRATSFTPSLEGVWLPSLNYPLQDVLYFFHTGSSGLRAEQLYVIRIDPSVPLSGAFSLGREWTISLWTQPVRIVQSSPRQGQTEVCSGCGIQLYFNSEMDSASVHQAFSLQTLAGVSVPGVEKWATQDNFYFGPDSTLAAGQVYRATVTTAAMSLWGDHLKEPLTLYFRPR